jgi:hypothetical protein
MLAFSFFGGDRTLHSRPSQDIWKMAQPLETHWNAISALLCQLPVLTGLLRLASPRRRMVQDLNPGAASADPSNFKYLGARVFFSAQTAATGYELWATVGQPYAVYLPLTRR